MLVYALVMYAVALLMVILGYAIYRGNTGLIHDYHQTRVKDKTAYGKAMGKALMGMSIPFLISGTVGLFTDSALPSVLLIAGLAIACIPMVLVQRKHNGGVF